MLAKSIWQPYASLVIFGVKEHETTSWRPKVVPEKILIHAAKKNVYKTLPFQTRRAALYELYQQAGIDSDDEIMQLPSGLLGIARVISITEITKNTKVNEVEKELGYWREGFFSWKLEIEQIFKNPIPWQGQQKLWNCQFINE